MKSGLYSSAAGMLTALERLNIISNNLANVNSSGFKADTPFEQTIRFYQEGPHPAKDQPVIGGNRIDLGNGPIRTTGRNLDMAFEGAGFLVVSGPNQEKLLTRNGSLQINSERKLVTNDGYEILDRFDKPVSLFGEEFYFTPKGDLMVDETYLTTLKVVDISDPDQLSKVGDQYFRLQNGAAMPEQYEDPTLTIGALEGANTELIDEMAQMIVTQRSYEMQARALEIMLTQILQKTVNDLPRPV